MRWGSASPRKPAFQYGPIEYRVVPRPIYITPCRLPPGDVTFWGFEKNYPDLLRRIGTPCDRRWALFSAKTDAPDLRISPRGRRRPPLSSSTRRFGRGRDHLGLRDIHLASDRCGQRTQESPPVPRQPAQGGVGDGDDQRARRDQAKRARTTALADFLCTRKCSLLSRSWLSELGRNSAILTIAPSIRATWATASRTTSWISPRA